MAETKKNMIKRLSSPNTPRMAMVLAHGTYASRNAFSLPAGIIIIFVSKTARYLPQSVINTEFYNVFTNTQRIHNILSNTNSRPPLFLKDWERRTYGPGDTCPDLTIQMNDPNWGMGLHTLPLVRNQLRTTAGAFMGQTMKLSELVSSLSGSGILFVTSCRNTTNQPFSYRNLTANYSFPEWSLEHNLQRQNEISSRMLKRRAGGASNSSGRVRADNNSINARVREINANLRATGTANNINITPYMRMIHHIKMNTFGKRGQVSKPVDAARRYSKFFPANMSNENIARWVNSIKNSNNNITNRIKNLRAGVLRGEFQIENRWRTHRNLPMRVLHRIYTIENR